MYTIEEKIQFEIPLTSAEARTLLDELHEAEEQLSLARDAFEDISLLATERAVDRKNKGRP
ncbi:MAG: hypothetical protein LBF61_06960 [Azoarcus sp.]|jgi:hypothetical protein|nr:hypothetical protein [Azoarcus sp.]